MANRKGPVLLCNNAQPCVTPPTLQKLNKLGYEVLPHPPNSPDLSLTDYHFFKHFNNFLQGQCFHNQKIAENTFQGFVESQSTDVYATEIKKLISHWQNYVECKMVPILINKDVFEPSYNDLNFMVRNHNYFFFFHNYFFANLIITL